MEELKKITMSLVFIIKDNKVLMGQKKRGFAQGTFNGFGGKQDPGETLVQTMIRETQEEVGLTPIDFEQVAKITFDAWYKGEHSLLNMNAFICTKYEGTITETEEMTFEWFDLDKIPYDKMLEDDKLWVPQVMEGKKLIGNVVFDKDLKMLSKDFKVVEKI